MTSFCRCKIVGMVTDAKVILIEKHAELIRFMISHSERLNEKIIELTEARGTEEEG